MFGLQNWLGVQGDDDISKSQTEICLAEGQF